MNSLRFKHVVVQAQTKELAIEKALNQLNASQDQIKTEILEEPKKGIFGFFQRDAKLLVSCSRPPTEKAELFLSGCLEKMGLDTEIEISSGSTPRSKRVNLKGDYLGVLIGKKGRTLKSLQYLVNVIANQDAQKSIHFLLDADGYQQRKEELLIQFAHRTIDKVKKQGQPVKLVAMSASERKVIHTVVEQEKGLMSKSEGVDPNRYVVIQQKTTVNESTD